MTHAPADIAASPHDSRHMVSPRLSVTILTFNSAGTIERTLAGIAPLGAEIVAVDSGSTDATLDLLGRAGARVIHQQWLGYRGQQQLAMDRSRGSWILSLDSDESLEPDLLESIRIALVRDDPSIGGYEVNRKVWYAGRFLNHAWQPEWRLRLVRRGAARWEGHEPHPSLRMIEAGVPPARVERLRGTLRHDTMPSLAEFLRRQVNHAEAGAASYLRSGRPGRVRTMLTSPLGAFFKQIILKQAWRDGWRGWVAAAAAANAALLKHMMLVEKTFTPERAEKQ